MSRRKLLNANEKRHYKMYKSGKQWFFAGMGVVAGLFGAGSGMTVSADEKPGVSLDLSQSEDLLATQTSATIPGSTSTSSSSTGESTSNSTKAVDSKSTNATTDAKSETQSNSSAKSTSADKNSASQKTSESTSLSTSASTSQSKSLSSSLKETQPKSTSKDATKVADNQQSKQKDGKEQKNAKSDAKQDVKQAAKDDNVKTSQSMASSSTASNQGSEHAQINDNISSLSNSTSGSITESASGSLSVSLSNSLFVSDSRKRDKDSASNSQSLAKSLSNAKVQAENASVQGVNDATQIVTYTDENGKELAPSETTLHNSGEKPDIPGPKKIKGYVVDTSKSEIISNGAAVPFSLYLQLGKFSSIEELLDLINSSDAYPVGTVEIKYVYKVYNSKISITGKNGATTTGNPLDIASLVNSITNADGSKGDINNVTSPDLDQVD